MTDTTTVRIPSIDVPAVPTFDIDLAPGWSAEPAPGAVARLADEHHPDRSITVTSLDEEFKRLWDAPVHTPALRWGM